MMICKNPGTLVILAALVVVTADASAQKAPFEGKVPFEGKERPLSWVEIRLGRFEQSNQWERLAELSKNALKVALDYDHEDLKILKDLKVQAQWYQTLVLAQQGGEPKDVLASLEKAIQYGYQSVQGIESADQLAVIKADDETRPAFLELVEKLRADNTTRARKRFQVAVDRHLERNKALEPSSTGIHSIKKPNGENAGTEGRPIAVVISRTYYAGFRKEWRILERAHAPFADSIRSLALFYESDRESAFVGESVARFARSSGVDDGSYAIIDRKTFIGLDDQFRKLHEGRQAADEERSIFNLYFPFFCIIDGSGVPLYSASGVLSEAEIAYALETALASLPAPKEPEPEPETEEDKSTQKAEPEKAVPDVGKEPEKALPEKTDPENSDPEKSEKEEKKGDSESDAS